jgi:hypothetical protein
MEYFESDAAGSASSDRRTLFRLYSTTGLMMTRDPGARVVKASLLIFLALIALAPILRTLTAPTSADSISALTTALFLVHATLADYSYAAFPVQRERCVSFSPFFQVLTSITAFPPLPSYHARLIKADLCAVDQCCDFGCSCASFAPA